MQWRVLFTVATVKENIYEQNEKLYLVRHDNRILRPEHVRDMGAI